MERTLEQLFLTVKVHIEREYLFPSKITGIARLCLLIGAYLLMGVVMSNAYKNISRILSSKYLSAKKRLILLRKALLTSNHLNGGRLTNPFSITPSEFWFKI